MVMIWVVLTIVSLLQTSWSLPIAQRGTLEEQFTSNSDFLPSHNELSILPDFEKRDGFQRIEENIALENELSDPMLFRVDSDRARMSLTDSEASSDDDDENGQWQRKPSYLLGNTMSLEAPEQTYEDSSSPSSPSSDRDLLNTLDAMKPLLWKRRLQMKSKGLLGSKLKGQKTLLGYSGSRNKGLVLSIDLGIKALRDAILHAKVQRKNRKMQAQAQRNMKMLHNIGKRRATPELQNSS